MVSAGLLAWRLATGPVRLDFAMPMLESALSQPDRGYVVRFGSMSLEVQEGIAVSARAARILSPEGTVLASFPEVRLGISGAALLHGVLAPSFVDLPRARVRLNRARDGSLRFALSNASPEGRNEDREGSEFDASEFLRKPDPDRWTGYLERIRVSDGTVTLIDERSNTVWRAPGSHFSIARDRDLITTGLSTTIDAPGGRQRLDASGGIDLPSGEAWLDLRIGGLRLARLAPLVPALEQASAIDMAFDATGSARFDAAGSIKQGRFQVSGRDGSLSLGEEDEPPVGVSALQFAGSVGPGGNTVTIDSFSADFAGAVLEGRGAATLAEDSVRIDGRVDRLDTAVITTLVPSLRQSAEVSLALEGEIAADLSGEGDLRRLALDLRGKGGTLTVATEPVEVARFGAAALIDGRSGEIRMRHLLLDLGGPVIEASGLALPRGGAWKIDGEAVARDVPVDRLDQLWPAGLADGGRRWITENLSEGRVTEAKLKVAAPTDPDADADDPGEITGSIAFEGVTARYWKPLPPFGDVAGSASFAGREFDVSLRTGRLGNIELQKGTVVLRGLGLGAGSEVGDIDVTFAGPLSEILTVLDHPPLRYAQWLEVDPAQAGGRAVASLAVDLPLLDDLSIDQVDISANAELKGVSIPAIALERDLSEADLTLQVDKTRLGLSGQGRLGGLPVRLDVSEIFEGEDSGSRVRAEGVLTDEFRAGLNPDLADYLEGPVPARVTMTGREGGSRTLQAEFDLTDATLSVGEAGWSKASGVPGTASATLALEGDTPKAVERFELNAGTGYAAGRAVLDAEGGLELIELDRLRLGERTDLQASLAFAPDGTRTVHVTGASADLSPLIQGSDEAESEGAEASTAEPSSPRETQIDVDLAQVWIGADYPLLDLSGHLLLDGDTVRGGEARADIGPDNSAHLVMGEEGGERRVRFTLGDTGTALRALGWVDSLSGGELVISAAREASRGDAPWRGKVESGSFRISGAPLAARLLAAASFRGLADLSSRDEGITFDRLEAPFVLRGERLRLKPGRAYGGALGVTFFGSVDTESDTLDIAGTIVPAYTLNRVLGSIPLLGALLTGGEGSGLFAATYRASGPLEEPEVSVNPLAALAPGFLRGLFGEIAGGGSAEWDSATDPAAERFPGNLN